MARAFTKESDNEDVCDPLPEPVDVLPPGVKNYITPAGATRLKKLLNRLIHAERPRTLEASKPDTDASAKKKLKQIDQQIRILRDRIGNFEIVDSTKQQSDRVAFGARVTVADDEDIKRTYTICGIDEAEPSKGTISWISPIAKALQSKKVGDEVTLDLPRGRVVLEILKVEYTYPPTPSQHLRHA